MLRRFSYTAETHNLFIALVDELATGLLPAAIMALTYGGVASYVAFIVGSPLVLILAVTGTLIGGSKCFLKCRHQRALRDRAWTRRRASRWQMAHAGLTLGFASHIGCVVACGFLAPDVALHILVTGMLFGYCSGTVTRISFRPLIAGAAICIATLPGIVAAAQSGDATSLAIATVFTVFLCGGLETIRHLYLNMRRQITLRHDMATLAKNDPLTRLLNRLGLREAFRGLVAEARGSQIPVHCLDLDGFKPVNDQYGHAAGDLLLQAIADRLRAAVPVRSAVARTGGDEFVIVQGSVAQAGEVETLAEQVARAIAEPFLI